MLDELNSIKSYDDIKFLYFKYKDSIGFTIGIVASLVVVAVIIFIRIVMPQAESWFSLQREINDTKGRIALLNTNISSLAAIDEGIVDRQFTLVSEALPFEKNYTGFVTAIDEATLVSGMRRDDYSFSVGNLSTKSAQLSPNTAISVKITVEGDVENLLTFLQTMQKLLPLSEIVSVSLHASRANIEMNFFYKYKPENFQIPYTDPLRVLSDKNTKLLQTLDEWEKAAVPVPTPALDITLENDSTATPSSGSAF